MVSTGAQAIEFIDWLLAHLQVQLLSKSTEWPVLRQLVIARHLTAHHIPYTRLVSLAISLSEPFATFDKGFRQLLPRSLLVLLPVK